MQVKVKVNVLVTYYSIGNISLNWQGSNYRNKGGSSNICHLAPLLGVAIEKGKKSAQTQKQNKNFGRQVKTCYDWWWVISKIIRLRTSFWWYETSKMVKWSALHSTGPDKPMHRAPICPVDVSANRRLTFLIASFKNLDPKNTEHNDFKQSVKIYW